MVNQGHNHRLPRHGLKSESSLANVRKHTQVVQMHASIRPPASEGPGIETTFGLPIERRQRPRSTPKPRRPSSTQRARGPSYQSKGLQSTVKPIPRTTPGSATTTGWRGCANTGPDTICQLDGTLTQQATQQQHYRVLSQIQISSAVDTD